MHRVLFRPAYLTLFLLCACETVPEEPDWPATNVHQGGDVPPAEREQDKGPAESDELSVTPNEKNTQTPKEIQKSRSKLDDVRHIAAASKTIAKVVVFAPLLPFCYLSDLKNGGANCQLDQ